MQSSTRRAFGFTLIELLVVIAVVALLIGILFPALGRARHGARVMGCLSNMRQVGTAAYQYAVERDGLLIEANLAHGGVDHTGRPAWVEALEENDDVRLVVRSPLDTSPHWGEAPDGAPIPGAPPDQRRVTSYGINTFLNAPTAPWGPGFRMPFEGYKLEHVPSPTATVHLLVMAYEGSFAGSDHPHIESWMNHPLPPFKAQEQSQINAAGGAAGSWDARSNYAFLDGHAETRSFRDVLTDYERNAFDPYAGR